jgi:LSD1 subclass zinc finger protein
VSILVAIVALCVVIIIHEFGHYFAAVSTGMKVDRFSVFGIGPAILKLGTWRGTEFVIGAIPFGAYVLIRGMEPEDPEDPEPEKDAEAKRAWSAGLPQHLNCSACGANLPAAGDAASVVCSYCNATNLLPARGRPEAERASPNSRDKPLLARPPGGRGEAKRASPNFRDKPLLSRVAVLAGGPGANYLAAIALFFAVFAMAGIPGPISITVSDVSEDSPAAAAGVEPGDELLVIGGTEIDPQKRGAEVKGAIDQHRGGELELVVMRDGAPVELVASLPEDGDAPLGITFGGRAGPRQPVAITTAMAAGLREPFHQSAVQLEGLWMLITGRLDADPQGPVGIVTHIARSADAGIVPFVWTTAFISTLLGMFNLLPLPALDGGRLAFLGYEAISGRRASPYIEERVHGYGMLALLLLIAVITVGDVRRLL